MNLLAFAKGRKIDNPLLSIGIVVSLPLLIIAIGLLSLEASFQWGATTTNKDGEIVYANRVSLRGWEAVPFQAIAGVIGSATMLYGGYKASHKQENNPDQVPAPDEPDSGEPG